MRSVWKGSISFGLVNIPVAVYPATREQKIKFRLLRKSDLTPVQYQKVAEAEAEEEPVATRASAAAIGQQPGGMAPVEEIVKGYEYERGKFVVLSEEDFEKVRIESTHTIEITDFVQQAQINPKYFYKPYFLEAQKGGEKGYSLLHRALFDTGKLGIAKVAIRSKEYLAAVKPDGLFLMLELMHFAAEVLEPEALNPAAAEVPPRELDMAKQLINAMSAEWEPEKYKNSYLLALNQLIEQKIQKKIQNRPTSPAAAAAPKKMVGDILEILKASLERSARAKPAKAARGSAKESTDKPGRSRSKGLSVKRAA